MYVIEATRNNKGNVSVCKESRMWFKKKKKAMRNGDAFC